MPYCVNCGVELSPSEPKCPLCQTTVVHPDVPWQEPKERPYPEHLEDAARHINRRYGSYLALIILLVPMAVTLLCDLLTSHHVTWSLYVLGAGAFLFCSVIFPGYLKTPRPYIALLVDTAAALVYLFLIALASGVTGWYWRLAMPIAIFAGGTVIACVWVLRRRRKRFLVNLSYAILFFGAFLIAIDCTIDLYVNGLLWPNWALYAFMPLLALTVICRVLNRKHRLLEDIRRRLYV